MRAEVKNSLTREIPVYRIFFRLGVISNHANFREELLPALNRRHSVAESTRTRLARSKSKKSLTREIPVYRTFFELV